MLESTLEVTLNVGTTANQDSDRKSELQIGRLKELVVSFVKEQQLYRH